MAGFDNTDTSEGSWHNFKIVLGLAIAGLFFISYALPVYGYYLVSTSKENIKTGCYWITGNTFHICENREMPLSEITVIDESYLTQQEYNKSKEDKTKFFKELDDLSKPEAELNEDLNRLSTLMDTIIKKKTTNDKTIKPDIKKAIKDINQLNIKVQSLKEKWMSLVIPSKNLLVLREIKTLEFNSLFSVCRDYKEYLDDWSPTIREYAREHIRQKGIFEASFKRHLEDLKKEKTSDDLVM
jgi:hypothetical protein